MKREDIRRENARALARKSGGLAEFGRVTGMENSQVSQIIGKTPSKNIGNIIARRIEQAYGLAEGILDRPGLAQQTAEAAPSWTQKDEFTRHWLSRDEADFLAVYRSLSPASVATLRVIVDSLERDRVSVGAVDES